MNDSVIPSTAVHVPNDSSADAPNTLPVECRQFALALGRLLAERWRRDHGGRNDENRTRQ